MSLQSDDGFQLGFIGGGKLAGSVLRGLVAAQLCPAKEILVSEPVEAARLILNRELGLSVTGENREVARKAAVILIGVKPGVVLPALAALASDLHDKLVISLAAGVATDQMSEVAPARFMRAMTNTPSAVRAAATAIARGARTTDADMNKARQIFTAIGTVVEVAEDQIDAVTALAGSGPAFVYTVIEALAAGGTECGLPIEVALKLATQTVLGAATLARETKLSPDELRRMVVTPGGTTAAGLGVMEKLGTAEGLRSAVEAAAARAKELLS